MAVEPLPGLRSGPRSTDLSEPILRALADGPKTSTVLAQSQACTPSRLMYYLEPLAWKHRLVSVEKIQSGRRGAWVCAWTLRVPLDKALEALRAGTSPKEIEEPAPNNTPSNTPSNDPNNDSPIQEAQPQELVEALEAEPPKIIEEPKPAPPQPLTRAQLAARLELIKSRHQALIAEGKIKTKRRHR